MTVPARSVLIVDDDELIREVSKASLELVAGWQVLTADSGAQAHHTACDDHPDVIVMDVMMPGQDGPTTFAHLQSDPRTSQIPVIFLTAKNDTAGWVDRGAAGVIAKPFDPMRLAAQVAELLGWT